MREFLEGDGYMNERSMNEVAEYSNSKILIKVNGRDHAPAHAHLYTSNGVFVCKFLLDFPRPRNASEVRVLGKDKVPEKDLQFLTELVIWATGRSRRGVNNWDVLGTAWDGLHPK